MIKDGAYVGYNGDTPGGNDFIILIKEGTLDFKEPYEYPYSIQDYDKKLPRLSNIDKNAIIRMEYKEFGDDESFFRPLFDEESPTETSIYERSYIDAVYGPIPETSENLKERG